MSTAEQWQIGILWMLPILVLLGCMIDCARRGDREDFGDIIPWFLFSLTPVGVLFGALGLMFIIIVGIGLGLGWLKERFLDLIFKSR